MTTWSMFCSAVREVALADLLAFTLGGSLSLTKQAPTVYAAEHLACHPWFPVVDVSVVLTRPCPSGRRPLSRR